MGLLFAMSNLISVILFSVLLSPNSIRLSPTQTGDIRKFDFQNFEFTWAGESVRVRHGEGTYRARGRASFSYSVERVTVSFGDMAGDGKEEAAVTLYYRGGGTGAFSTGLLFALTQGKLTLLAQFEGGDRADGGIREVKIVDGRLRIQRNEPERNGTDPIGICCPAYYITTTYQWNGKKLVQEGPVQKVDAN
jgi:hypothetical protein